MLSDLTAEQRVLAEYMSDLSEEAYCAGWMDGLEYALWQMLLGTRQEYGRLEWRAEQLNELRRLADTCGGWIVFDDETEQTWLPLADWESRFTAWQQRLGSLDADDRGGLNL